MNSSSLGTALVALVAGLIGAGTLFMMQSLDEQPARDGGAVTAQQIVSLQRQLTDVLDGQGDLQRRLQQLELDALRGRPESAPPMPLLGSPESVAAVQEQLSLLNDAVSEMKGEDGPAMFTMGDVSDALQAIRDQEDEDRDAARELRREERLEERLAAVASELSLDTYQQQQLGDAARLSMETMDTTMSEARESGDWGSMRDAMETSRTSFEAATALFLSLDQQTSFTEMGGLRALGGFGGGPPGGGFGGRRSGR